MVGDNYRSSFDTAGMRWGFPPVPPPPTLPKHRRRARFLSAFAHQRRDATSNKARRAR
jgi:hypothetical protein